MSKFEITDYSVCEVCLHLMANGEYNDGTNAADVASEAMQRKFGDDVKHFVASPATDLGFSWCACETCDDELGGERYRVTLMIPTS